MDRYWFTSAEIASGQNLKGQWTFNTTHTQWERRPVIIFKLIMSFSSVSCILSFCSTICTVNTFSLQQWTSSHTQLNTFREDYSLFYTHTLSHTHTNTYTQASTRTGSLLGGLWAPNQRMQPTTSHLILGLNFSHTHTYTLFLSLKHSTALFVRLIFFHYLKAAAEHTL